MDPELAELFAKRHQRELDAEMEEQTRLHGTWLHQQVIESRAAGRAGQGTDVQDKQKLPAVAHQWEPSTAAFSDEANDSTSRGLQRMNIDDQIAFACQMSLSEAQPTRNLPQLPAETTDPCITITAVGSSATDLHNDEGALRTPTPNMHVFDSGALIPNARGVAGPDAETIVAAEMRAGCGTGVTAAAAFSPEKVYKDDFDIIDDAEQAIKHQYDPVKKIWARTLINVVVQPQCFAEGNLRKAFHMKDLSVTDSQYVLKVSKDPDEDAQAYFDDVQVQMEAKMYAEVYNGLNPPKLVTFLDAYVLEFRNRPGKPICAVEKYIEGEYKKYNNNWSWSDDKRNTPQAFSHFTFEHSNHQILVCDIQGVGDTWTDPQIHSSDGEGYGKGNLGQEGIKKFLGAHKCNQICQWLGLSSTGTAGPREAHANHAFVEASRTQMSTQAGPPFTRNPISSTRPQDDDSTPPEDSSSGPTVFPAACSAPPVGIPPWHHMLSADLSAKLKPMGFSQEQVEASVIALGPAAEEESVVALLLDNAVAASQPSFCSGCGLSVSGAFCAECGIKTGRQPIASEPPGQVAQAGLVNPIRGTHAQNVKSSSKTSRDGQRAAKEQKNWVKAVRQLESMGFSAAQIDAAQQACLADSDSASELLGEEKMGWKDLSEKLTRKILELEQQAEDATKATIRELQEADARAHVQETHQRLSRLQNQRKEEEKRKSSAIDFYDTGYPVTVGHRAPAVEAGAASPGVVDYQSIIGQKSSLYGGKGAPPARPPPSAPTPDKDVKSGFCMYACGTTCKPKSEDPTICSRSVDWRGVLGKAAVFFKEKQYACCLCAAARGWEGFDRHGCAQCKHLRMGLATEERERERGRERATKFDVREKEGQRKAQEQRSMQDVFAGASNSASATGMLQPVGILGAPQQQQLMFHSANYHQIQHQLAIQQRRQHSQSQLSRQQQGHMQQHARMPAPQHQVMSQMRANMIATQQPPHAQSQEMQLQTPAAWGRGGSSTAQYPILNPHMQSTRGT